MLRLDSKIFVAGHLGMVGSAIIRQLEANGYNNIITRTRGELDLVNQKAVADFFATEKPDAVFLAAAKVGGIYAINTLPAEFIYENLMMECNIIHQAYATGVQKLLFLGSSCIYPKLALQPMSETALLTSILEETNEPIAKIAGIKLSESYNRQYGVDYRSVMPTNLYGPQDNFHPVNSHIILALLRRFHEANLNGDAEVIAWGSGKPMREFLYVDDMAAASIHVMMLNKETYESNTSPMLSHINVGIGVDCSIRQLVETVAKVTGFEGSISFDATKPDGAPRKLMNVDRLTSLGWTRTSISMVLENQDDFRS
jgi:GDP-L-fucose synthase